MLPQFTTHKEVILTSFNVYVSERTTLIIILQVKRNPTENATWETKKEFFT